MARRLVVSLLGVLPLLGAPALSQPAGDRAAIDAAVRAFMERNGVPGVAVGFVTPSGRQVLTYGVASKETGAPVDDRTLFEIGSISKTFTVALAAYAAEKGALRWDDPASAHLPELKGSALDRVSLLNLATHTSGGMPLQLPDSVRNEAELTAFFRNWSPPAKPGSVRTYANPSIGLLGVATARVLKGDFAALVREKILSPLGLSQTFYDVPKDEAAHYAQGYNRDGRPVRLNPAPLSTEAYGVRTTAGDLLRFVQAQFDPGQADPAIRWAIADAGEVYKVLYRALLATQQGQFRVGPMTQSMIWEWYPYPVSRADFAAGHNDMMVFTPNPVTRLDPPKAPPADSVIDKTGGTGGFGAYAAFIPGHRIGLVILSNRNHPTGARVELAEQIFRAIGAPGVGGAP